jgi:hypothetical protein
LFKEYLSNTNLTHEQFKEDLIKALELIEEKVKKENDKDKREMYTNLIQKCNKLVDDLKQQEKPMSANSLNDYIIKSKDVLSQWLDKQKGTQLDNMNSLFSDLSSYYEGQFHKDMKALNVKNKQNLISSQL